MATDRGLVRGAETSGVVRFLGVPFAQPPSGALRFMPPSAAACWTGTRSAVAYAEMCPQRDLLTQAVTGSEDCLYLNVWAPKAALTDGQKRPVLVWIFGGGNVIGGTNANLPGLGNVYDGQRLAQLRDAVVVSVSYRIGSLGFLATKELTAASPFHSSGSYGILDQIAALSWVQRNITQFGGNPARVMVFGESAGAVNTCSLVASPLAKGLFSSAVMQSGYCAALPLAEREALGELKVKSVGCEGSADVAACLRNAPLDKMTESFAGEVPMGTDALEASRNIPAANIDGWVLTQHPLSAMEMSTNPVPMIIGSNADESAIFLVQKTLLTCSAYESEVQNQHPTRKAAVLALYPCSPLNPKQALIELQTDSFFTCAARRAARAMTAGGGSVWRYWYAYSDSTLGAYHAAEVPYVFGTTSNVFGTSITNAMQGYWSRFAASGDPNSPGVAYWARYDPMRDNAVHIDSTIGEIDHIAETRCDYWDSVTPR